MKIRISNKKSRNYVENLEPFQGSNLHGELIQGGYAVYSYKWWLLMYYCFQNKTWYINEEKYSRSTSRQLSQARPNHPKMMPQGHEEIKLRALKSTHQEAN